MHFGCGIFRLKRQNLKEIYLCPEKEEEKKFKTKTATTVLGYKGELVRSMHSNTKVFLMAYRYNYETWAMGIVSKWEKYMAQTMQNGKVDPQVIVR